MNSFQEFEDKAEIVDFARDKYIESLAFFNLQSSNKDSISEKQYFGSAKFIGT